MKEKFLPIGSICTLNNKTNKTIIVGYYFINNDSNSAMFDYYGCDYPDGLLKNNKYAFNHQDIINLFYLGDTSNDFEVLNRELLSLQNSYNNKRPKLFNDIRFDENGVVIFDEPSSNIIKPMSDTTSYHNTSAVSSNFFAPSNTPPSNSIEDVNNSNEWSIFKNLKFDENGVIISE